jgi:hypothetical protein
MTHQGAAALGQGRTRENGESRERRSGISRASFDHADVWVVMTDDRAPHGTAVIDEIYDAEGGELRHAKATEHGECVIHIERDVEKRTRSREQSGASDRAFCLDASLPFSRQQTLMSGRSRRQ